MNKKEYQGGKCKYCNKEDIFHELTTINWALLYAIKNHTCYTCAADCLKKRNNSKK